MDEVVRNYRPSRVLEVGTLVGYSAIRMGRHMTPGQRITCIEKNDQIAKVARENVAKAGLSDRIEVVVGDAKEVLPRLRGPYDMVFLDASKEEYLDYLKAVEGLMGKGGVVVADNVKSFGGVLGKYLTYVRGSGRYKSAYREFPPNPWQDEGDAVEVSVRV